MAPIRFLPPGFQGVRRHETTATKPHHLVDRAGELGGRVGRGSRRASPRRPGCEEPGEGQLAHRRRRQPAHGVAEERDPHLDRQRQEHEAAVEASVRQPAPPDAQPLPAPHRHRRDDRAGAEGNSRRGRRLRQHLRRRRRDRHAALVAEVRQHVRRTAGRPRRRRAVPRRIDRDARHRPDRHGGQVPRLCGVVGRTAAHARRGNRYRRRAARAISPAQRKALRAEPLEGRHLHDDGAGLRRESERVLRLRPGDEEGRSVLARQRRPVAAHRSVDWQGRNGLRGIGRRRLLSRASDLRPVDHRREAEPADQGARVEGLVYAVERLLAAQARSRHERHRAGLRLQGQGVPGPVEQGVPPVAARHERARRRGSSHAGLSHAAHLQRGRQLRRHRYVGRARDVGGDERHALDSRAVLGPEALAVHRADRVRRRRPRRGRRLQDGRQGRQRWC